QVVAAALQEFVEIGRARIGECSCALESDEHSDSRAIVKADRFKLILIQLCIHQPHAPACRNHFVAHTYALYCDVQITSLPAWFRRSRKNAGQLYWIVRAYDCRLVEAS